MGAEAFYTTVHGKTAEEAFQFAREEALHMYGHSGYTGTIAEKHSFSMIPVPEVIENVYLFADELMDEGDYRIDDKWGPAGCIKVAPEEWLFFGWASA